LTSCSQTGTSTGSIVKGVKPTEQDAQNNDENYQQQQTRQHNGKLNNALPQPFT